MKLFRLMLIILLPLTVLGQDAVLDHHYKIYSTADKKLVLADDIIKAMNHADVLFFGEEHDDSIGHLVENLLQKKLAEKYPHKAALSMEMFETDCQTVLNEYLSGFIREKNFTTDARAWPNYSDYRPMVEFAKANRLPMIAANAPGRYVNMVNRLGLNSLQQLDATGKSYLPPLPIDTAVGRYYEKFVEIMGGHAAMQGMGDMKIYQAQNLWDATMGWSIARFLKTHPGYKILQLNGGFHSEEKLGAAAQLLHYSPKARIINIAAYATDNFIDPDWSQWAKNADYIIVTGK